MCPRPLRSIHQPSVIYTIGIDLTNGLPIKFDLPVFPSRSEISYAIVKNNFNRGNNFKSKTDETISTKLFNHSSSRPCFLRHRTGAQNQILKDITANECSVEETCKTSLLTSSGVVSGTLPGNTVTNPKEDLKADFVVVDFEPDPRVPLILGRCFLKTSHALIDVYEGEITLSGWQGKPSHQPGPYFKNTTADYNHMTVNKIDVIDMACDEYSQEVLGFSNVIVSGNPTPYSEPIVSTASPTLTPFGDSDFLLFEEADSFLALEDVPPSSEVDPTLSDPEGDILF
ncbi:reverse transcriptase domain-containing protein [Tanacetum coccineum]